MYTSSSKQLWYSKPSIENLLEILPKFAIFAPVKSGKGQG